MKKLAALITLLVWSISTAASASEGLVVLCVEKSGAVSFEYSDGARCADQDVFVSPLLEKPATIKDGAVCPSCRDSSLASSAANSAPQVAAKAIAAQPAVAPVAVIQHPVFTALNGLRAPPTHSSPIRSAYLTQRPTVVILQ